MKRGILSLLVVFSLLFFKRSIACEQCKCQGASPVDLLSTKLEDTYKQAAQQPAPTDNSGKTTQDSPSATPLAPSSTQSRQPAAESAPLNRRYKWYFDTMIEFIQYRHVDVQKDQAIIAAGRDTHGHVNEFNVTQRFAYSVTSDIQVNVSQGFRALKMLEIVDPNILGQHEESTGPTDLEFGLQYRFLHQHECGCPVDLLMFASVKAPTGRTDNRKSTGDLFETEDQPGTGSWNETLGLSAGKRWGQWGASATYSYTHKGEGSQRFKEGDVNRFSLNASRKISPDCWSTNVFLSQGVQGFTEKKAVDQGQTGPDHGGQFIYAIPGVTVQPLRRLLLTTSASVPLYQHENGFHQPDNYGIQFNIGLRF